MMKKLLIAVFATLVFCVPVSAAKATDVYLTTRSSSYPVSQLTNDLRGLQQGVAETQRWWGGEPVTLIASRDPPARSIRLTILPSEDLTGFLGYHDVSPYGVPFSVVLTVPGYTTSITISHELSEMIVDPFIKRLSNHWLVEISDPVERGEYGYIRYGVALSDFVGPNWYRKRAKCCFDYRHYVKRPLQLLPGGYATFWNGSNWVVKVA